MQRLIEPKRGHRQRGVTLVELVVVLTIVGVVASIGATLVGRIVASQQANRSRLTLAMSADAALARVADELQLALPNSLRLTSSGGGWWVEWVPITDAGRFRAAPDTVSASPGDPLDLDDPTDSGFDVLGTALAAPGTDSALVLSNLGTPEADVYAGTNRRAGLAVSAAGQYVAFTPDGALPAGTGQHHFFIVGTPVTLACQAAAGGGYELRRYGGYGWMAAQPATASDLSSAFSGATAQLLQGDLRSCAASYSTALANIGLLNLRLGLEDTDGGARMDFLHQLPVDNTP